MSVSTCVEKQSRSPRKGHGSKKYQEAPLGIAAASGENKKRNVSGGDARLAKRRTRKHHEGKPLDSMALWDLLDARQILRHVGAQWRAEQKLPCRSSPLLDDVGEAE